MLPNKNKHFFSNSKQIDVSQVSELLTLLVPLKGSTKAEVAGKLKISPQLLGQYMKERQNPKPDFYKKWKETFGEDLLNYDQTNVSRETATPEPAKQDPPTRIEEILERHNSFLQRMLESNLNKLSEVQYMVLAQVQAGQKWDAKNISKGNMKKYIELLDEISTLAGESLSAFGIMDIRVPVNKEGKSVP